MGFGRKDRLIVMYLASHADPEMNYPVSFNYYSSINQVLDQLAKQHGRPVEFKYRLSCLYNKFGQEIPAEYQIHQDRITFYIDLPGGASEVHREPKLVRAPESKLVRAATPKGPKAIGVFSKVRKPPTISDTCMLSDSE